jgi:hypothetical protein
MHLAVRKYPNFTGKHTIGYLVGLRKNVNFLAQKKIVFLYKKEIVDRSMKVLTWKMVP